MISAPLKALLAAIRSKEAPMGYGQIYGGAKGVPLSTDVSKMRLRDVLALQQVMKDNGSYSTACGGYQFINKTLKATMAQMGLTGHEVWTPDLQDRMALWLLEGRGLSRYMAGRLSAEDFANNLSMEWASLPVVKSSGNVGSAFYHKKVGQSFYSKDGVNKAHHKPSYIMALVYALKQPGVVYTPPPPPDVALPEPAAPIPKERGVLMALIEMIMSLFKRRK